MELSNILKALSQSGLSFTSADTKDYQAVSFASSIRAAAHCAKCSTGGKSQDERVQTRMMAGESSASIDQVG